MFGSQKHYLSFSLNENNIKVVQAKPSGAIEKIARGSADSNTPEALGQTLKTLLHGFDTRSSVLCVIPASVVTSKTLEVPSVDPQEIKSIINLQVSRHTPYSREEVLLGYINLGIGAPNNTKVLLVIVHRNVIKDRLTILEKASLAPDKILFVPEGIGRLYSKGLNLKKDSAVLGVIDVAATATNFVVVNRGSTIFCRSIPIGIKQIVENHDVVTKLVEEINKSIAAYTSEDSAAALESFIVSTDNDVVQSILPNLKEGLKAEVRVSPYIDFIQAGGMKNVLKRDFADDSFLDAIAPVAVASKCEINLMPEEMVQKKNLEKQSREAIKTIIGALLIIVLIGIGIWSKIYFKQQFLNKNLKEDYAPQREEVQKLQERLNKIKTVKGYMQDRMVSLDIIRELYKLTPNQIYLNSLVLDENGVLTLTGISSSSTGVSDSMSQVYNYEKALSGSAMFKDLKRKSLTTKKDNNKDVAAFEVSVQVAESSKETM